MFLGSDKLIFCQGYPHQSNVLNKPSPFPKICKNRKQNVRKNPNNSLIQQDLIIFKFNITFNLQHIHTCIHTCMYVYIFITLNIIFNAYTCLSRHCFFSNSANVYLLACAFESLNQENNDCQMQSSRHGFTLFKKHPPQNRCLLKHLSTEIKHLK